jgi:hypothetical protein
MDFQDIKIHATRIIEKQGFTHQTELAPTSMTIRIIGRKGFPIGCVTFPRSILGGNLPFILDKIKRDTTAAITYACRDTLA